MEDMRLFLVEVVDIELKLLLDHMGMVVMEWDINYKTDLLLQV